MAGLGAPELLIVLTIILLVFGGSKLPQLARSLGSAKREFEHGSHAQGADPGTRDEAPSSGRLAERAPLAVARGEEPSRPGDVPDGGASRGVGHERARHDAG